MRAVYLLGSRVEAGVGLVIDDEFWGFYFLFFFNYVGSFSCGNNRALIPKLMWHK